MEAKALESSGGEGKEGKEAVPVLREIIPKCGLLYSEKGNLTEVSPVLLSYTLLCDANTTLVLRACISYTGYVQA